MTRKGMLLETDWEAMRLEMSDRPTVVVSGGFDPLHVGHLRMIEGAQELGRVIVVCNGDDWLTRKKGKPFMRLADRMEIVAGLRAVTFVTGFESESDTVVEALEAIRPDCFANGGDRVPGNTPEEDWCAENGVYVEYGVGGGKIRSSSELVKAST